MAKQRPVEDLFRDLHAAMYEIGQSLRYWRCYNHPRRASEFANAMEPYSMFFQVARIAFLTTAVVGLHRLYDANPKTLSLEYVASRLNGLALKHSDSLDRARVEIDAGRQLIPKVTPLRHQLFAHRSAKSTTDEVFARAAVSPDDLFNLHSRSKQPLNSLSHAYDGSSYAFNLEGPNDFEDLLTRLAEVDRGAA